MNTSPRRLAMSPSPTHKSLFAWAGACYLLIIVAGLWSEAIIRDPILDAEDPTGTFIRLHAALPWVRASIAADMVMLVADVALAILLYEVLKHQGPVLALMAVALRLTQAAVLGASLLHLQGAVLLAGEPAVARSLGDSVAAGLASLHLLSHAHGYDLGLVFFGVNSLLTGLLLTRTKWSPRLLGAMMLTAGLVYLVGSTIRLLAPSLSGAFAPAYALPMLAESLFCLQLLRQGMRR